FPDRQTTAKSFNSGDLRQNVRMRKLNSWDHHQRDGRSYVKQA
ncbi:hypothetical protein SOVF_022380 isoform B, partial [Spinacia oleracea]